MKKIFFSLLFVVFTSSIFACPYCGCGNSNFQIGVLPTFSNAFFGVRYTYSHFKTDSSSQFSSDYFHTAEFWGGYKIGKIQAMVFVPYISIHKNSDDGNSDANGLGDITALVNYQVFSKTKNRTNNTVSVGGGVKFPTGKSLVDLNDPDFSIGEFSSTPGTGSWDYLLNANHNFALGNNGVVTNVAYRINTANPQQYRYGNRFYFNTVYYHAWNVGLFVFRPSLGLNLIANAKNHFQNEEVMYSNGYVLSGTAGVNVQRGKIGLLLNGALPVAQNIFEGLTKSKERLSVALTFSI